MTTASGRGKRGKNTTGSSRKIPRTAWKRQAWFLLIPALLCGGAVVFFAAGPFWRTSDTSPEPIGSWSAPSAVPREPAAVPPEPSIRPRQPASTPAEAAATPPEAASTPPEAASTPPEAAATPTATIGALEKEQLEVAERLAQDFPGQPVPIALIGRVHEEQGKSAEALKCWETCLKMDPNCVEAYRCMGSVAFRKAEYKEAVALWRKVLEINPRESGIHNLIGRALICLGKTEEAIAALERDIELSPGAFHSHFLLGQRYLQSKEYEKAKKSYRTVIEMRPGFTNAYYGLVTVCARLGQKDEAKQYQEKFKQLAARDLKTLEDRSEASGDVLFARRKVSATHTETGQYYAEHGNARKAEQLWRRAATLDPRNKNCRLHLTALYRAAGRDQDAVEVYEELRQIDPEDALIYAEIGLLNIRMGQFDAAEEAFRKIIELAPQRPEGYSWIAQLYLRTNKNFSEAKTLAATAVRLVPTADNYSILGEACDRSGDRAGALSALKRALELDPDSEKYKRIYRRIEQRE